MIAATAFAQQIHGYQGGHGLLRGNVKLNREDQDLVDRLSDIAGPLRPGETFERYLTTYPLPSEQFYVVARTWQDLDAPRAGCVLTSSLFVPMDVWEQAGSVLEIIASIPRAARSDSGKTMRAPRTAKFGPLQEKRLPELVEALFLESRRPIVVFDSPDAEAIALRVLTVLWPSRRRNFATCTRCLSPRKLKGREFDLVFAPSDARSRFSDWNGRRIDTVERALAARHRWTAGLVKTIFSDGQPSLASLDELGILDNDQVGDEGALRLSLMWRELEAKAQSTPNAVLGMLDILNSQSVRPATAREHLEPLVANAVDLARRHQSSEATWRFYLNLLGKFSDRLPSRNTLRELRDASERLAADDPASAISALRDLESQGRDVPAVLAAGIGDGLSRHPFCDGPSSQFVGKRDLLRLVAYSKRFSASLADGIAGSPSDWTQAAVDALEAPDRQLVKRARRNLLPVLDSPSHVALLYPLLNDVSPTELSAIVRTVAKATNFNVEAFDRPIIVAARTSTGAQRLREAVLEARPSKGADRLLGCALRLDPDDVSWLTTSVPPPRGRKILADVLDRADDGAIQTIMRDASASATTLDWLLTTPRDNAQRIVRLLRSGLVAPRPFVEIGLQIHAFLDPVEKSRLEIDTLKRALGDLPTDDSINLVRVLEELSGDVDASDLVVLLTQPHANQERIKANIAALSASQDHVRRKAASRVDQLTARLISRGTRSFDETTFNRWADLIQYSRSTSNQSHLGASIEALSYALKQTRLPLSALIVTTFPTVYGQLLASQGDSDFEFLPALLMLPFTLFTEWDRPKSARRELVDSFLNSSWPPANLMLAALGAGIDQKILRRVSRSRGGSSYIDSIWKDAGRLQGRQMHAVRDAITRFTQHARLEDWD
jgi:GTPase-associated protein 1, N-terminal domain type 1